MWEGGLYALDPAVELRDVAGEFLAEGKGGGILEVGTANLDDVVEVLGFFS